MVITQSGETADTIAAQREALIRGAKTVAISNVADSTISREASASLLTGDIASNTETHAKNGHGISDIGLPVFR